MTVDDRPDRTPITMRSVTSATWVIAGICALMALAARTTGSGWLVVIMCMLAGVLVIGLVTPRLAMMGIGAAATGPADTVAGAPTDITVTIARANLGVLVRLGDGPWSMAPAHEPVPLTLDEGEGAVVLLGILRADHHERVGKSSGGAVCADLAFLHGFEQCGLGARRGAVDLVHEHDIRKKRPGTKLPAAIGLVEHGHTGQIRRQKVRRRLNASKDTAE